MAKRYQKEELIRQIRMLAEENGKPPTMVSFNDDPRVASSATVANYFGSWNNALKNAGLSVYEDRVEATKNELLDQLHLLVEETGEVPTIRDFNKSQKTSGSNMVYRYFDSWNAFLSEGGYKPRKSSKQKIPNEELIEQVRNLAVKLGRNPNSTEFNISADTVSSTTALSRYGTWSNFLYQAGLIDKP